jgi:hypothetical protein
VVAGEAARIERVFLTKYLLNSVTISDFQAEALLASCPSGSPITPSLV